MLKVKLDAKNIAIIAAVIAAWVYRARIQAEFNKFMKKDEAYCAKCGK